jgi:hypothetical protein
MVKVTVLAVSLFWVAVASAAETRCGWWDNPSPSNVSLIDKDGEWLISQQGEYSAKGKFPKFDFMNEEKFVPTGQGSYGHGCVCLKVATESKGKKILKILSSNIKPVTVCLKDPVLQGKEPEPKSEVSE